MMCSVFYDHFVILLLKFFCFLSSYFCCFSPTKVKISPFYRFAKSKKPTVLMPFVPLTFIVAYQAHLAYGNKIKRIRGMSYFATAMFVHFCHGCNANGRNGLFPYYTTS